MKILASQDAILTNYEVYTFLKEQRERYSKLKSTRTQQRPGNLETLVKELLDYFQEAPSPLGSASCKYSAQTLAKLLERLRPYDLTKAEIVMIINLRPTKPEILNTMVEELETRFDDEKQREIAEIIAEVLGQPDGHAERQAMQENAEHARQHNGGHVASAEEMDLTT